jgi:hypothetical protein
VAELRTIHDSGLSGAALLDRWRHVPAVDPVLWREDVDELVDPQR